MLTINGANINAVFPIGLMYLRERGMKRSSRNGPVLEIMEPVSVTYYDPHHRVLLDPVRDANPFFHLFESLWMLAGRQDVAFLEQFNSNIGGYSDNGETFNAAYGYRLRRHFGIDQLHYAIEKLKRDPDDRRVVMQLWDVEDLKQESKDLACNLMITPRIRRGRLDITVFNRSNDYLWGLAGANVVHMSVIQEYMSSKIGIPIGYYTQVTNCLHVYTDTPVWQRCANIPIVANDFYVYNKPTQLMSSDTVGNWDTELAKWMLHPTSGLKGTFFGDVAAPMAIAYFQHKESNNGTKYCENICSSDWRKACQSWLERRESQQVLDFNGGN